MVAHDYRSKVGINRSVNGKQRAARVKRTDRLKSTRPIDLHWQTHASDLTRVSECLYFREKIPLRENARRTGLSRNTLRTGLRQLGR